MPVEHIKAVSHNIMNHVMKGFSMDIVKDKFIKMRLDEWRKVKMLALELSAERGGAHVSLPAAISEAVHFYRAQRNKAEASNE
jgi:hypothetical protein